MDQKEQERLFGEIAFDLGYLNRKEIDDVLAEQQSHEGTPDRKPIGEYLLGKGALTEAQIEEILTIQGKVIRLEPSIHDN